MRPVIPRLLRWAFSPRGLRRTLPLAVSGLIPAGLLLSVLEGPEVSAWDGVW